MSSLGSVFHRLLDWFASLWARVGHAWSTARSRPRSVLSAGLVAVAAVGLLVAVFLSDGFRARAYDLEDAYVWVTDPTDVLRFNRETEQLDWKEAPPREGKPDVIQDGTDVFATADGRWFQVDVAEQTFEEMAGLGGESTAEVGGGTFAVLDRDGGVWVVPVDRAAEVTVDGSPVDGEDQDGESAGTGDEAAPEEDSKEAEGSEDSGDQDGSDDLDGGPDLDAGDGAPVDAVEMRAGAVGAVDLVAGLALRKDLFALRRVGRGVESGEVRAGIGLGGVAAVARVAGVDRIGLRDLIAVADGAGVVKALCRPLPKQEDEESPAQRAAGLGYRHRVEHVAPRSWQLACGVSIRFPRRVSRYS